MKLHHSCLKVSDLFSFLCIQDIHNVRNYSQSYYKLLQVLTCLIGSMKQAMYVKCMKNSLFPLKYLIYCIQVRACTDTAIYDSFTTRYFIWFSEIILALSNASIKIIAVLSCLNLNWVIYKVSPVYGWISFVILYVIEM